ncbi:MAG: cytosine permease, partial [Planctomycetota bacterium]|nr:cytosine permease [Planctomycetota bacterium]
ILIADYFLLRKTEYDLNGLFRKDGPYWYKGGFNPIAIIALVLGVLPNIPGFLLEAGFIESAPEIFQQIYTFAWFVGFFLSGAIYTVAMKAGGSAKH